MTAKMSEVFNLPLTKNPHMSTVRDGDGFVANTEEVTGYTGHADAIVRAVNEYDADKATIAALVDALNDVVEQNGHRDISTGELLVGEDQLSEISKAMRALALAEGRS